MEQIVDLVRTAELPSYDVALDEQAQVWLTEHQACHAAQDEEAQRLRQARQQLRVGLSAQAERRLLGVGMEQVLEALAEHVESAGEGLVQIPAVKVDAASNYPH